MLKFRLLLRVKGKFNLKIILYLKSSENLKRPEITSRKLEIPKVYFIQDGHNK